MSSNNGWVSLHRAILEWEWYDDINATRLFIHCLLRANHEATTWRGIDIPRGSFYTSLDTLSKETRLTVKQIRTCFTKLERTGELASSGQARGRMVTVVNYDSYQQEGKQVDKQKGKEGAANNNDNKKQIINNIFSESGMNDEQVSEIIRIRKKNKGGAISERVARSLIKEFIQATQKGWSLDDSITEWDLRGWKSFKSEWLTNKGQNYAKHERLTPIRPDNSASGRVRQNAAKRRAEIAAEIAEIDGNDRPLATDGLLVRP